MVGLHGEKYTSSRHVVRRRFGVEILAPQEAVGLRVDAGSKFVKLADGVEIGAKSLLIATGVAYRKLDVPGLERLQGAGVYYGAAMTEAASCKDEDVFIVGGANSAGQAAMYFANYARRVVMLVRGSSLRPGAVVTAWLGTLGPAENGVIVPRSAIVRHEGGAFVYVQSSDDAFERRRVELTRPTENGWFVDEPLRPGERAVVAGAQQLLSEELKSHGGEQE